MEETGGKFFKTVTVLTHWSSAVQSNGRWRFSFSGIAATTAARHVERIRAPSMRVIFARLRLRRTCVRNATTASTAALMRSYP